MGKNTKVMPQYPAIYLFPWEREGILTSQNLTKKPKYKCAFCPVPSTEEKIQIQTKCGRHTSKLPKICIFFPQILHLSSNRSKWNLAFYFQFTTPARKLTHNTKFKHFWMQKDTNFGNAMILWHFGPEKCQKSYPERLKFQECHNSLLPWARESPNPTTKDTNFRKLHSLTPAKMPTK